MASIEEREKQLLESFRPDFTEADLEGKSFIQLKRILSFFDPEIDQDKYNRVKAYIDKMEIPVVDKAHYGERIWSYFYEKYLLRVGLIIILMVGFANKSEPVIQASRREFSSSWLYVFLAAAGLTILWKISQIFLTAGVLGPNPIIKNRINHITVNQDGSRVGIGKATIIHIAKSYSLIMWTIFIGILAQHLLAPDTFKALQGITGTGKPDGLLPLFGVLFLLFWVADMVVLERTGRSLHDRLTKTYVLTCLPVATDADRARYIRENYPA